MRKFNLLPFAVLSIALLPGCGGEPEWVGVYENCKEQMSTQTAEMQQNAREAGGDLQAEAMLNSLNTINPFAQRRLHVSRRLLSGDFTCLAEGFGRLRVEYQQGA